MKNFISNLVITITALGLFSTSAFAFEPIRAGNNLTLNPRVISQLGEILQNLGAVDIRSECTKNIENVDPNNAECKEAIEACVTTYVNVCANRDPFNCVIRNGSLVTCDQDPRTFCSNPTLPPVFSLPIGASQNDVQEACGQLIDNPQDEPIPAPVPSPAAAPASPNAAPTQGGSSTSSADVPPNPDSAGGCSLSSLQASGSIGGMGLFSTLMMIPFALRRTKKNK